MSRSRHALLYTGGYNHPFEQTSPILTRIAQDRGWTVTAESDIDAAAASLEGVGLLIVNALRWSMTQDQKYAAARPQWAAELSDRTMDVLEAFVADGGRLLAMHTATICWDTQPRWRALMGGGWSWGQSHHPPLGDILVELTAEGRALSAGPAQFALVDEVYHRLDPADNCVIAAVATAQGGPQQPVAWTRTHGDGRVAVDALGHDARSLEAPAHQALIAGLLGWLDAA